MTFPGAAPQPAPPHSAPPHPPPASRSTPAPAVRGWRRPVFGWIGFACVGLAVAAVSVILVYSYGQTEDAFIQGPPWWVLSSQLAATPVGVLCFLGLVFGSVGTARREKPGWPAVAAMIFSLPGLGYVAVAIYVWFTVATACAGPAGSCGV